MGLRILLMLTTLWPTCLMGCATHKPVADRGGGPPRSGPSLADRAEAHLRDGRPRKAAECFAELNRLHPDAHLLSREALAWLLADEPEQAAGALARGAATPTAQQELLQAVVSLQQGDEQSARSRVERYVSNNGTDPGGLLLKSDIACRMGDTQAALDALHTADSLLPAGSSLTKPMLYNLTLLQLDAGLFADADVSFERYLQTPGRSCGQDLLLAGVVAYANNDHDRAASHWRALDGESRSRIVSLLGEESELYASLDYRSDR